MRTQLIPVLRRLALLDAMLWARGLGRAARSAARARAWQHRLDGTSDPTTASRYKLTRERADVWVCEPRTAVDPIETFVESFEQ
jgi:hypothetical protein